MKINFGEKQLESMVRGIASSASFRKKYAGKVSGLLSNEQMISVAKELWEDIAQAYANTVPSSTGSDFTLSDIFISMPTDTVDGVLVRIEVSEDALHRYSLLRNPDTPGEYTGSGVYDILGLLTQGYHTKTVVGCWANRQGVAKNAGYILSLKDRDPNPFIKDAANAFAARHVGVEVKLPELWE